MVAMLATKQMTLEELGAHRAHCVRVAHTAPIERRKHTLAEHYDRVVLESWAQRAFNQETGFKIANEIVKVDAEALERAKDVFYSAARRAEFEPKGKGKGKSYPSSSSFWHASGKSHGKNRYENAYKRQWADNHADGPDNKFRKY